MKCVEVRTPRYGVISILEYIADYSHIFGLIDTWLVSVFYCRNGTASVEPTGPVASPRVEPLDYACPGQKTRG
jgi:hypothetical protein